MTVGTYSASGTIVHITVGSANEITAGTCDITSYGAQGGSGNGGSGGLGAEISGKISLTMGEELEIVVGGAGGNDGGGGGSFVLGRPGTTGAYSPLVIAGGGRAFSNGGAGGSTGNGGNGSGGGAGGANGLGGIAGGGSGGGGRYGGGGGSGLNRNGVSTFGTFVGFPGTGFNGGAGNGYTAAGHGGFGGGGGGSFGIGIDVGGGTAVPISGTLVLNPNGPNAVSVIAIDPIGNVSTPVAQTLSITEPTITGTVTNQGVPNETPSQPFAAASVVDAAGGSKSMTVTLTAPGAGTLSNLSGGSYSAATGVYSVSGTPAVLTAALRALVFTPIAQPSIDVTTTGFTIALANGGPSDDVTTVTAVQQILGLAVVPINQIVIVVSPDGTPVIRTVCALTQQRTGTNGIG